MNLIVDSLNELVDCIVKYSQEIKQLKINGFFMPMLPVVFTTLKELKKLEIVCTGLNSLCEDFDKLSNLETLIIDNNGALDLPKSLSNMYINEIDIRNSI